MPHLNGYWFGLHFYANSHIKSVSMCVLYVLFQFNKILLSQWQPSLFYPLFSPLFCCVSYLFVFDVSMAQHSLCLLAADYWLIRHTRAVHQAHHHAVYLPPSRSSPDCLFSYSSSRCSVCGSILVSLPRISLLCVVFLVLQNQSHLPACCFSRSPSLNLQGAWSSQPFITLLCSLPHHSLHLHSQLLFYSQYLFDHIISESASAFGSDLPKIQWTHSAIKLRSQVHLNLKSTPQTKD